MMRGVCDITSCYVKIKFTHPLSVALFYCLYLRVRATDDLNNPNKSNFDSQICAMESNNSGVRSDG